MGGTLLASHPMPTRRSSHQSPTKPRHFAPSDVTAVSYIRGTRRTPEDTRGHDGGRNCVQEDTGGTGGTPEDISIKSSRFSGNRPAAWPRRGRLTCSSEEVRSR